MAPKGGVMAKKQNTPFQVDDAVGNIRTVGVKLKNLHRIVNTAEGLEDLESSMEITELVLEKQVEELNEWLGELAGGFEDVEYKPIDMEL